MSTIEIEIPELADIYIYVQKNMWHPPVGKYHVLRMCHNARPGTM